MEIAPNIESRLPSVLVVDDDPSICSVLQRYLVRKGCETRTATNLEDGRRMLTEQSTDVLLVDFNLAWGTGDQLAKWALSNGLTMTAYCITGSAEPSVIVAAIRSGCSDVITKPIDFARIDRAIEECSSTMTVNLSEWLGQIAPNIYGSDPEFLDQLRIVRNAADTDATILIMGESGTGKELFARAIHDASLRAKGPFVPLNCAAVPDTLFEGELFGHTKGAFTGALAARDGRFVAASGGTLFLDEIGDMPLGAQAKLLRVLQDRVVTPLGSETPVFADVRIVAATNKDLEGMSDSGTFRKDLLFRLSVIILKLPSLRERPRDIIPLARKFICDANVRLGREIEGLDPGAERVLLEHSWPGNIRELANVIERAVVVRRQGLVTARDLAVRASRSLSASLSKSHRTFNDGSNSTANATSNSTSIATANANDARQVELTPFPVPVPVQTPAPVDPLSRSAPVSPEDLNLRAHLERLERELITMALERTGGNRTEAAALLGLNRTTLLEKLRRASSTS